MVPWYKRRTAGFTLTELLVSISIIILVAGVLLTKYPSFRRSSALSQVAREVGLAVREAQVYGLAVREAQINTTSDDFPPYGVNIRLVGTEENAQELVVFADVETIEPDTENIYDARAGCGTELSECLERVGIPGGIAIDKLCVSQTGNVQDLDCSAQEINVTFRRPEPEAFIVTDRSNEQYNSAEIVIAQLGTDNVKTVRVWITGQISIR